MQRSNVASRSGPSVAAETPSTVPSLRMVKCIRAVPVAVGLALRMAS
jgi:hypothetical protein